MELKQRDADVVYTMAGMEPQPVYKPSKKAAEKRERQSRKSGKHINKRESDSRIDCRGFPQRSLLSA